MGTAMIGVKFVTERDAVSARMKAHLLAELLGYDTKGQGQICTAVWEIVNNAFRHAGGGEAEFLFKDGIVPPSLTIVVRDHGPGIADVDAVMKGRAAADAETLGGIAGVRQLVDGFRIESRKGEGTSVFMTMHLPASASSLTQEELKRIADLVAVHEFDLPPTKAIGEEPHSAQQRLLESEERFRTLYENSTIGLYRTTPDGRVLLSNPTLVKMLGYSSFEELAQLNVAERGFVSESGRKEFLEKIETTGEVKDHESAWRRKDGSVLYVSESARALRDEHGNTLYYDGTVQDITERKKAEEQLRLSEQTYRGILNSISDAVYIKDEHGVYLDVNTAGERMFGFTKEEMAGQTAELILVPEKSDPMALQMHLGKALQGEPQSFEIWGRRKDGTIFPVDIRYSLGEYFGKKALIIVARDITERKAMDELLRDVQRREAIGVMSSGIAHDFNNLLGAMMGNVSLAQTQLPPDHPVQKYMGQALIAMDTAAELVKQILAYTGRGKYQSRIIDLAVEIREHANLFRLSMPKNVRLSTQLPSSPVCVAGDPGQIKQIIMNLIMNGGEAIGGKQGEVTVTLEEVHMDSAALRAFSKITNMTLSEGAYAKIEVRDTGVGVSADSIAKIFDPFFSTKFIGRGLGLAAVLGIIRSHEGGIAVESAEGHGSTFTVVLPLASAPAPAPEKTGGETAGPPAEETTVLIIDDEEIIALMAQEMLESEQYRVMTELNPVAGIELFRKNWTEIGIVLLDLTMPEMSGKDVMEALLEIDPSVKIIISSGHSEQETSTRVDMSKAAGFMQKPYTLQTLLAMVKSVRKH